MTTAAEPRRTHWLRNSAVLLVLGIVFVLVLYTLAARFFTYSSGFRAGTLQKFSQKGWLCKTWEGEIAQYLQANAPPVLWQFTVKNDSIATAITAQMGKRVSLHYRQHQGIPTTCFGDTEYYVDGVSPAPL